MDMSPGLMLPGQMHGDSFLACLEVAEKFVVVVVVGGWSRPRLEFSFSQAEQKKVGF